MEILQLLLSFLAKEFGGNEFAPLLENLKSGSFDLRSLLQSLTPEMVAPLLKPFLNNQNSPQSVESFGVNPIINFVDRDIVFTLNKYFAD